MEAARLIFGQFKNEGLAAVGRTISEGWQEDLWLDFKLLEGNSAPMTTNARQKLAESLSGFANSDGGVVVWGIYAASANSTDPDVAKQLEPIRNLKRLLSDLQSYSSQVVSPAVIGVEHLIIESQTGSDVGYAVTYVPKGEGEPHMARAKDQHRYYYRSGCSFLPMESFMISDRFGRRPQPKLELSCEVMARGCRGAREQPISIYVDVVLGIKNSGLGIAEYPVIVLTEDNDLKLAKYGLYGNGHTGLPERPTAHKSATKRQRYFAGGINDIIHPGIVLQVTRINYEIPFNEENWPAQHIEYELYCKGVFEKGETTIPIMEHFRRIRETWPL